MWKLLAGLEAVLIGLLLLGIDIVHYRRKIMDYLDRVIQQRQKDERAGVGDHIIDEPDPYDLDPEDDRDKTEQFWAGVG